ncbi:hypothetical protein DH09_03365 [Bacillaceae bacterium JMAK1]|nr:hypothetical protein DH09_03365 [Bacillaceae bacterium JMAK1]
MRIVTMVLAVCLLVFVILDYTTGYSFRAIAIAFLLILIPTFVYERWRNRKQERTLKNNEQ